jgi:hypothetical protein
MFRFTIRDVLWLTVVVAIRRRSATRNTWCDHGPWVET